MKGQINKTLFLLSFYLFAFGITSFANAAKTHNPLNLEKQFNIPKQTLDNALVDLAEQANIQLIFIPTKDTSSIIVGPIYGKQTVRRALINLLSETELKFKSVRTGSVSVYTPALAEKKNERLASKTDSARYSHSPSDLLQEEIVVTGIKTNIKEALKAKKQSGQIEDALYYHTISKYPDTNAGDTLQRIPGVSVNRLWGESRNVYVRGTDSDLNQTTLNGQYMASAYWLFSDQFGRAFNFFLMPSEFLHSVEVYKSPSADQDEGSIGGNIDLKLKRPFHLPSRLLTISHKQQYNDLPNKWDPKNYFLGSWTNEEETLGFLSAFYTQKKNFNRDALEVFLSTNQHTITLEDGTTLNNIGVPIGIGSTNFNQERQKQSIQLAMQWRPNENFELSLDSVTSSLDADNVNHNYVALSTYTIIQNNFARNASIKSIGNHNYFLTSALIGDVNSVSGILNTTIRDSNIEMQFHNAELKFSNESWNVDTAFGQTSAKGGNQDEYLFSVLDTTRLSFDLDRDQVHFEALDVDLSRADESGQIFVFERSHQRKSDDSKYFQIDVTNSFSNAIFTGKFKFGVKRQEHNVIHSNIIANVPFSTPIWHQLNSIPFSSLTSGSSRNLNSRISQRGAAPEAFAILDPKKLESQVIIPALPTWEFTQLNWNSYDVNENINSFYVKSELEKGKSLWDIGVRITQTQQRSHVYPSGDGQFYEQEYTNYLPSINWRYAITDDLYLRASLFKSIARPSFDMLGNSPQTDKDPAYIIGNPLLKPTTSNQGNLGIEWYFSDASILAGNFFHTSFRQLTQESEPGPIYPDTQRAPGSIRNAPGPDLSGFEFQWQQYFYRHFGLSTNYTYTQVGKTFYHQGVEQHLRGNSRDQLNASIFFEQPNLSVRLSYNYRSKTFGNTLYTHQNVTNAFDQWDFDASWSISGNLTLSFEAINLLNEIVGVNTDSGIPVEIYDFGSSYTLGFQYNFF